MADAPYNWSWSAATGAYVPGDTTSRDVGVRLATAIVGYENKWGLSRYPAMPMDGSFNATTLSALADVMRDITTSSARFPTASADVASTIQTIQEASSAVMPAVPAHVLDIVLFVAGYIHLVEKYENMSISIDIPAPSPAPTSPSPAVTITKIMPPPNTSPGQSVAPSSFPWKGVGIAAGIVAAVGIVGLVAWKA